MEDEWTKLGDIGSMLPDVSEKVEDKKLRDAATNSFANSIKPLTAAAEDNLDFGGYQPSCVAKPPPSAGRRRGISPQENKTTRVNGIGILGLNAACTDIFAPKSGDNKSETNATQAKAEKVKDETAVFWEQPSGLFHEDSLDTKEVSKRNFQANLISSPLQQGTESTGCQKRSGIFQEDCDIGGRRGRGLRGLSLEERHTFQLNSNIEKDHQNKERELLFPKVNETLSVKESLMGEKSTIGGERQKLKEENIALKDEIIKLENEKLKLEKEAMERKLSYEGLSKRLMEERDEAQQMSSKLASEVQFLKRNVALAEEKIASLQKIHEQETEMLKVVHARELEARDNQLVAERALLTEHKISIENLSELIAKAREWSAKVESLEEAMVMERGHSSKDKHKWLESLENVCHQQAVSLQEWGRRSDDIFKKVEGIVETLEKGTREMEKDHTNLQGLQEAVQVERLQSLAEVTTAREKLEEVRNSCFQEKEEFLAKIMQERKELEIERENVLRMKEQLFHVDAILEKQLLEHTFRMQTEAEEIFKQKLELEKAKEMAAEIAHEMENGRHEVEEQHKTFEQDGSYELDATLQYDQRKHQRFKDGVDVTSLHVHDMFGKAPRYLHKENEIPKLLSVLSKTLTPRTSTFSRVNASQLLQNNMRKKMNHGSKSIGSLLLKMPKSNNKKNKRANPDLATPPFNGGGEVCTSLEPRLKPGKSLPFQGAQHTKIIDDISSKNFVAQNNTLECI